MKKSNFKANLLFIRAYGLIILVFLFSGCAPSSYVTLLENPDGTTGQVSVTGQQGTTTIDKSHFAAELDGSTQQLFAVTEERIKADFSGALAAQPMFAKRFLLYFETGGTVLTPESEKLLPEILAEIASRPTVDVSVIGHTDTEGDAERNELLGLQRAEIVEQLLRKQNLQVTELNITSHGERNLLVPTADNVAEPRNRLVEISIR